MQRSYKLLLLLASVVCVGAAQDDPPARVGRLSYMNGPVSFRSGEVDDWVDADFNRPLTIGDHLWTDDGARAEVYVGNASLRLNARTAFEFLNLDDSNVQVRLAEGSLNIRVRSLGDQETVEIDTPNIAFSVLRPGDYRIDVDTDRMITTVTVRGGQGEVTGGGQAFTIRPGEEADISGDDNIAYNLVQAARPDDWDAWCADRNRREDSSPSAQYVSRDMVGYQDLDDNGSWRNTADYGAVWVPSGVAADWAPYRYGHWVWVDPWGWTWVDDARWGFAPFHYGRWVYVGYWAWVPGPVAVRPVYAPALVAWIGGSGFSAGISFGGGPGIGWFPLGPREVYVPAYHASPVYVNRVNVTNTVIVNRINITNVYNNTTFVNRNAPGAITAVPQNAFGGGRSVQRSAVRIDERAVRSVQVTNVAAIAPSRQSVIGNAGNRRATQPPAAIQNRQVVARTPPPPARVPFDQKQQALGANPGRPLDPSQVQRLRTAQPVSQRPVVKPIQLNGPGARPVSPAQPPRQVERPIEPNRPAGRDVQPPQRQVTPPNMPSQQVQRPARDVVPPRQVERPAQTPPPPARDVTPQQPQERQAQPVRPPTRENAPPSRVPDRATEQVRPPARDAAPPARIPERQATPDRPARSNDRPAQREAPKQDKKQDKKDDKKKKDNN